jgi:hypothetical protein
MIESIAYLIANPVEALAVRYAKDWPGAHTLPAHVGTRVIRVERPPHYFDHDNPDWPDVIELRLEMPVALELDYGEELARERIAERVRHRQHQAWNKAKRTGVAFVGAKRVLRPRQGGCGVSRYATPRTRRSAGIGPPMEAS